MMRFWLRVLRYDLQIWRDGRNVTAGAMAFFVLALLMAVLGAGSGETLAGVIWLVLPLGALLGMDTILERDRLTGALDDLVLSPLPLPALMAGRALVHAVCVTLPLAALAPFALALFGGMDGVSPFCALIVFLPAALAFSFIALAGAALALAARGGGALLAIIVLPLMIPPVIFGSGALLAWQQGLSGASPAAFLAAYAVLVVTGAPFAAAMIVKFKQTA